MYNTVKEFVDAYRKKSRNINFNFNDFFESEDCKKIKTECFDELQSYLLMGFRDPFYLCLLGNVYYYGFGTASDYDKASACYERGSLEYFDANCLYNLAICYFNGEGVSQSKSKAVSFLKNAASQNLPKAQNLLARCYSHGIGIKQNLNKAIYYYTLSGNAGFISSQLHLGYCYVNGEEGLPVDYDKAISWYLKAGMQGSSSGYRIIGDMYAFGQGVEVDYQKAIHYLNFAVRLGNANALDTLGLLYFNGTGVPQDYEKAVEYFERAAKIYSTDAFKHLGMCYYNGFGVSKDLNKALECYKEASIFNDDDVLEMIDIIKKEIKDITI